jgi:DNA replication protein DnaC
MRLDLLVARRHELEERVDRFRFEGLADLVDIGSAPLNNTGKRLLFRLVGAGYERLSWPSPSADRSSNGLLLPEHTTASILDYLMHHATILITSGESYRMRHADHKKGDPT